LPKLELVNKKSPTYSGKISIIVYPPYPAFGGSTEGYAGERWCIFLQFHLKAV